MRTLGIDLASQPANTAACVIDWSDGSSPVIHEPSKGLTDKDLLALIAEADVTGIDAPFGWPSNFVEFITAHAARGAGPLDWADDEVRRGLRLRAADVWIWRESGLEMQQPLSVSTNLIALPALRCAGLLASLGVVDRSGDGRIFEVYPAAALKGWIGISRGYKGKKAEAAAARAAIVGALKTASGVEWPESAREDDDKLDAVVAALVARAAAMGLTEPIPEEHRSIATREGWIHVPTAGSLGLLAGGPP